jgi:hypothetical protein
VKKKMKRKGKIVEGTATKTVRPEGDIYEQYSDILLNWKDIRIKFGYKTLGEMTTPMKIRRTLL